MQLNVFILMYIIFIANTSADAETCGNLARKVQLLEAKLNQLVLQSEQHSRDLRIKENRIETLENEIRKHFKMMSDNDYLSPPHNVQGHDHDAKNVSYKVNGTSGSINHDEDVHVEIEDDKQQGLLSVPPHGKRIIPQASGISGEVAFYAYMSSNEHAPSRHHTLIFDVPRTNIGNSYNKYSGLFTAPSNGVYHFSWTIYSGCHSNIPTEILRNDEIYGAALADSEEDCDYHASTTNVIIELNQGDIIFIRTSSKANSQGDILSIDSRLKSTFSGFKLN